MMDQPILFKSKYLIQEQILSLIGNAGTDFYLTGGAALSHIYLNHRFCDTLEYAVNDSHQYGVWVDKIIQKLSESIDGPLKVIRNESRVTRITISQPQFDIVLLLVNDLPCRTGQPRQHPVYGKVDVAENILCNRIIDLVKHRDSNHLADLWGLCCRMGISLAEAVNSEEGKSAGIFPLDLARVLCLASRNDWNAVDWIDPPPLQDFLAPLHDLGECLIFINKS